MKIFSAGHLNQICSIVLLFSVLASAVLGQSSGGSFRITSSVTAGGGGSNSSGGGFNIDGTVGQPGAGTQTQNPPLSQVGGFWPTTVPVTPTAAAVDLSGKVTTERGIPLAGVVVRLNGAKAALTITDANGVYSFSDLDAGGFYTVTPALVNYVFAPVSRSFSLSANHTDAVFTAIADAVATANPLDTAEFFVRQQYVDLLGREPDQGGFNYWSAQINKCGTDPACLRAQRLNVAAAFFMEAEFQVTGSFIYDVYASALGRRPVFAEYSSDRRQVVGGANLDLEKTMFVTSFVQRAEFVQKYQANPTAESFIDSLIQNASRSSGVDFSSQRDDLIVHYNSGTNQAESRAFVLRDLADSPTFRQAEYNSAFVLTEYFCYLRRDPDEAGYVFWLNALGNSGSNDQGNYRGMVCSFVTSAEYQQRFSSVVTRSNAECSINQR